MYADSGAAFWYHRIRECVCVLTVFVDVAAIVDLRRALLAPQQLLLGLAFLHLRDAVDVHVQLANAAA